MSQFPFIVGGQQVTERRGHERRLEEKERTSTAMKRNGATPLLLILLGLLVWQWRYVVSAPLWLVRAHWADRSDLYLGKTNGISNRSVVEQARNYLTQTDQLDVSGNGIATEVSSRPTDVHLDAAWFVRHAPDSVDFNPFISGGKFEVTWLYVPGAQKTIRKSIRTDTDWFDLQGRPRYPLCRLYVEMDPNLRLSSITAKTTPAPSRL